LFFVSPICSYAHSSFYKGDSGLNPIDLLYLHPNHLATTGPGRRGVRINRDERWIERERPFGQGIWCGEGLEGWLNICLPFLDRFFTGKGGVWWVRESGEDVRAVWEPSWMRVRSGRRGTQSRVPRGGAARLR
jgi:hypothetical protein